jgi:hypothetical protein
MKHTRRKSNGTRSHLVLLTFFLVAVVALIFTVPIASAGHHHHRPEVVELDDAEIFFEENDTDGDLGIQFFLDGEAWKRIKIFSPNWRRLIDVKVKGNTRVIGLTELFSESAEPGFDELPRDEFLELFPPGTYKYLGMTVDGEWLWGEADLTHDFPAAPTIYSPEEATEDEPGELDPEDAVIEWCSVDGDVEPERYQVIVEFVELIEINGEEEEGRVFEFAVDILAAACSEEDPLSVTVPAEFFESLKDLDGEYKVEVLAVEDSGNKIITEREFELEDDD